MSQTGRVITAAGPQKRFEAAFSGRAFAPHRHDTYTFALTLAGVQSFDYRGACRFSLPGELVVLHPDELHDGQAGTEDGFRYRGINIAPSNLVEALDGRPLPFIQGGRSTDTRLITLIAELVQDLSTPLAPLHWQTALAELAETLCALDAGEAEPRTPDKVSVLAARDFIDAHLIEPIQMEDLETATGVSRWQLSRDFRALLGTSPYRYATLRRLDRAKACIFSGLSLAETAYACGFSDQAHLTRQFKATLGVTPRAWSKLIDTRTHGTIIQ
ncbi:AraC family transcriptional regulator [Maricaulis sp.]|uniref:helix-turn-helix domain-containing protein n=1 Tax=Maricaulis sp. TaxID=1486257 RepID=UPI002607418F|nr:AraC family transcriptional regulator [Maricaulis sp.]